MKSKPVPPEALFDIHRRRLSLPPRSPEKHKIVTEAASLYGVSECSLYRALSTLGKPKATHRKDHGYPRIMPREELENFCEIIAAIKIRTSNKKGRYLPTTGAIKLLETFGIVTSQGLVKVQEGKLKCSTVNRYLRAWGYDHHRLCRQPAAVRFQAEYSNACWQFDLSSSDLKHIKRPSWIREGAGAPTLMIYSVVDDRSGAAYLEYHCVYGEDIEAALRFLFRAMSPKNSSDFPQGIPEMIYTDNGPVARSQVFQRVMAYLNVDVQCHMPAESDGRRKTARAKGKVERPFRTVKELHETLYHLHEPETEEEANAWLIRFLIQYNRSDHRSESCSRIEDWLRHLPESGLRAMCEWDQYCHFAREPEQRKVGIDSCITVDGITYELMPELAGETVVLWWGLYDQEVFVEFQGKRYGPYCPSGGPIPLHKYRAHKKTALERRSDRIEKLAKVLSLPEAAHTDPALSDAFIASTELHSVPFTQPDPFLETSWSDPISARRDIAESIGLPLAKLSPEQLEAITHLLDETLVKEDVLERAKNILSSCAHDDKEVASDVE